MSNPEDAFADGLLQSKVGGKESAKIGQSKAFKEKWIKKDKNNVLTATVHPRHRK